MSVGDRPSRHLVVSSAALNRLDSIGDRRTSAVDAPRRASRWSDDAMWRVCEPIRSGEKSRACQAMQIGSFQARVSFRTALISNAANPRISLKIYIFSGSAVWRRPGWRGQTTRWIPEWIAHDASHVCCRVSRCCTSSTDRSDQTRDSDVDRQCEPSMM